MGFFIANRARVENQFKVTGVLNFKTRWRWPPKYCIAPLKTYFCGASFCTFNRCIPYTENFLVHTWNTKDCERLFIPTQQIHSYSTRSSSSGNYYISHSRLNQKNDSFSIMGAKIWNSIPENLRNSSKSLFKEKVHTILLKIFEVQDRYADLNTIISDFKKY